MPKTPNCSHLCRTKCSFFPNCKQMLYITTFKLLRTSSRSWLQNTVVQSIRFALLWNSKIYSIFETYEWYLYNYTKTKNQSGKWKKIEKINIKLVISIPQCNSVNLEKTRWNEILAIIFWTRKFWKIRAFDYNQHVDL